MLDHQDVGRFEIAVDDTLLVRVLHALAHRDEKLEPLTGAQGLAIAEVG